MAAQSITTDLSTMTLMESGTSTADIGGGQGSSAEPDFFIQGLQSFSRRVSGSGAVSGLGISATGPSVSGQHIYVWAINLTAGLVNTTASGGVRIFVGNSTNAYDMFYVNGSEDLVGGWRCYPIDYEATADATQGNPTGTGTVGALLSTTGTINRPNLGVDAIRYGTGIDATGGGTPDPDITFSTIANQDSLVANQWGILQPTAAGVNLQGRVRIGADDASTATTFADVDAVLTKANNNPVGVNTNTKATFSGIILSGSLTTATFTGCLFISLDAHDTGFVDAASATNSIATSLIKGCTFLDWGTVDGTPNMTIEDTTFANSGVLTPNGSLIKNCLFDTCAAINAENNLEDIQNCTFSSGSGGVPAISTSIPSGTYSLVGNTFVGYNASDGQADSAVDFTATTGTITINVSGGAVPSFRTAGATVVFQVSSTLTLTGLQTNTEVRVYDAGTTTEVAGVENSGTTEAFSINVSSVDIVIHNVDFIYQRLESISTTTARTLPIQQQADRNYENP